MRTAYPKSVGLAFISLIMSLAPAVFADGVDDLVIYRPSSGQWFSGWTQAGGQLSFANGSSLQFGTPDYDPLLGNVSGNPLDDILIRNRTTGRWLSGITAASGALTGNGSEVYGPLLAGDIPRTGDLNGDGRSDIVTYRADNGQWISGITDAAGNLTNSGMMIGFGTPDYTPLVGDVNGDGRDDIVIYNRTTGRWLSGITAPDGSLTSSGSDLYGPYLAGDIPLTGDLNGDGRTDMVLYRPSDGLWYSGLTTPAGALSWAGAMTLQFGSADFLPLLGDMNGDGRDDLVIYNKTNGRWVTGLTAPGGILTNIGSELYGPYLPGDIPLVGDVGGTLPEPATGLLLLSGVLVVRRRRRPF
jgi:hypothetical protein